MQSKMSLRVAEKPGMAHWPENKEITPHILSFVLPCSITDVYTAQSLCFSLPLQCGFCGSVPKPPGKRSLFPAGHSLQVCTAFHEHEQCRRGTRVLSSGGILRRSAQVVLSSYNVTFPASINTSTYCIGIALHIFQKN